jgi:flagellar hook-associated protein 3 FlgL
MRVTDASAYTAIRKQIMHAREQVTIAQERAGTGLRVQKPSDDPVAAAAARRETSRKALADAGLKTTEHASMQLQGSDEALDDVFEALTGARQIAIEGSSSSMSDENRRAAAGEVRKIREQMVALGNTNVAGRYVFAGFRDQEPAFETDGTFVGDASTREVQAMPGLRVAASISGAAVFGTDTDSSVFKTLDDLAAALESNDRDAVNSTLTAFGLHEERVIGARSQIGSMMGGVQVAQSIADRHSYRAELELARLTQADEITSITDLLQAKSTLEKALSVAQQIPVGSLAGGK